ncbi:MAG: phenylalanine--tRNA ligase subunit alpha, partial [Oscillospiraceae bacterium]|nr:phenylalanine--tRNA ligase subunit alpha [Oscillospiraceae bacterium]
MENKLRQLKDRSLQEICQADTLEALESIRVKYLGKKGELTAILKQMGSLSPEERPVMGQLANQVREALTEALESSRKALAEKALEKKLENE